MPFVLDASIALAWCFEDENAELAGKALERLKTDRASCPAIWPLEIANSLAAGVRRKRISLEAAEARLDLLEALPIKVHAGALIPGGRNAMGLSARLDMSVYDAAYLDLALKEGLSLATLDRRLAEAARQLGIPAFA